MFNRSTANSPTNIIDEDNGSYTVNVSGDCSIMITEGVKGKHRSADVRKAISRSMKGHSNFEGQTHTDKSKIAIQIARGHDDRIHGKKWSYAKSTGKTNRTMQLPNDHKWGRGSSTSNRTKRKLSSFGK